MRAAIYAYYLRTPTGCVRLTIVTLALSCRAPASNDPSTFATRNVLLYFSPASRDTIQFCVQEFRCLGRSAGCNLAKAIGQFPIRVAYFSLISAAACSSFGSSCDFFRAASMFICTVARVDGFPTRGPLYRRKRNAKRRYYRSGVLSKRARRG